MSKSIFDRISSTELMDFSSTYQPVFNQLAEYFPETRVTSEFVEYTDFDLDFNPAAIAVADNTVSPQTPRPNVNDKVQRLYEFKRKHSLSSSEIRKLLSADTELAKKERVDLVFADEARLINAHAISREVMRAQALYSGKIDFSALGLKVKEDFTDKDRKLTTEQLDLKTADILDKIIEINKKLNNYLSLALVQPTQLLKLMNNKQLKEVALTKSEAETRPLTRQEVADVLREYAGITLEVLTDNRGGLYHYTDDKGTPIPFIPDKYMILTPGKNIGATAIGVTTEELVADGEYNERNNNGVAITSKYTDDPVNYYISSTSRVAVVHPHVERTAVLEDNGE